MVKSLYTDPIDWDSPELLRIRNTVVLLCKHVFDREDVNNTNKSNGYTEFYWRYMFSTSTNVDFLRNDMSIFFLSSSCNTVVTNLQQNIYCRYIAVTSIS